MDYRDYFLGTWTQELERPIFNVDTYSYSYDGKANAYEAINGADDFFNFVAGVIETSGFDGVQSEHETIEGFLGRANVSTNFRRKGE